MANRNPLALALKWLKLLSVASVGQAVVQGLALVSGSLVIQLSSPQQYAYDTLADAALGPIGTLADCGISAGVMARGARDWRNALGLGGVAMLRRRR